jgi:hypothetical protein
MKLSKVVREVIRLAKASRAYWDRELLRRHPAYPVVHAGEDSGPPPPEDARLRAILEGLPDDQLYAITLLALVGRGDFSADCLTATYDTVKDMLPSRSVAIEHVSGQIALAEYLTDAVEELKKRQIDMDSLKFPSTTVVR